MQKKFIVLFIAGVFLLTIFSSVFTIGKELKEEKLNSFDNNSVDFVTINSHDGWLELRDGVRILHLSGSNYDMGYQYGALASDEIQQNLRAQLSYFEDHGWPYDEILDVYYQMDDNLPQKYIDEMEGMADGSGWSFEDIAVLNTIPAIFNLQAKSCCEVSLWGPLTVNGELYHIRGWDWTLNVKDPETGTPFHETQFIIVRDPTNDYASMDQSFAGSIFSWGGINEKGIAIGETTCITDDTSFDGVSAAFRMRMVLDDASSGGEAISIMSKDRTCGWNFVISDGNVPEGFVIEQTANLLYVGEWDNPVEDNDPYWKVNGLVRRVPYFIHPETAKTQPNRDTDDPSGLKGFIMYLLGKNGYFGGWSFYRVISEAVEDRAGTLNLDGTMQMIRDVYAGKTDLLFWLIQKIGFVNSVHQWVSCPKTGDFLISFAEGQTPAFRNKVHSFNLFDLLEEEPPLK
jgi:hypothetical protein